MTARADGMFAGADVWLLADTGEADDVALLAACEALLDDGEHRRLAALKATSRRREFVLGHALARIAMTRRVESVAPAAWRLGAGVGGRPEASALDGSSGPALSIAHTRGLLVVAVASAGEVGVDVEWCGREPHALALAERFFATAEVADLRARSEAAQVERFLALWTMKEAYLKARGVGLRLPLRDIVFRLPAGAAPAWMPGEEARHPAPAIAVAFAPKLDERSSRWSFRQWAHAGGHLIGFAHGEADSPPAPRLHELDPGGLLAAAREGLTSR